MKLPQDFIWLPQYGANSHERGLLKKMRAEREEMSGKVIDLDIAHRFLRIFDASFRKDPP